MKEGEKKRERRKKINVIPSDILIIDSMLIGQEQTKAVFPFFFSHNQCKTLPNDI